MIAIAERGYFKRYPPTTAQMQHPTPSTLERLLANNVDAQMLDEIAHADYGESVFEHLAALRTAITGSFIAPIAWEPMEVLELVRWSEPMQTTSHEKPDKESQREHWMRLFSCTVLLKTSSEPENHEKLTGEDSTIIQFVRSAIELADSTTIAAIEFLEWLIETSHSECPLTPLALTILRLSLNCDQNACFERFQSIKLENELIRELISDCQLADKWRIMIERYLVDSNDSGVKQFGTAIIG